MFILIQWDTPYDQRSKRGESDVFLRFFQVSMFQVLPFFLFLFCFFLVCFSHRRAYHIPFESLLAGGGVGFPAQV